MGKTQQTLWLAGFTGLSATCMTSFLFSVAQLDDPASAPRQAEAQPHALLAANSDSDQTITQMFINNAAMSMNNIVHTTKKKLKILHHFGRRAVLHRFRKAPNISDQYGSPNPARPGE